MFWPWRGHKIACGSRAALGADRPCRPAGRRWTFQSCETAVFLARQVLLQVDPAGLDLGQLTWTGK